MPSKGNPAFKVRLSNEDKALVLQTIEELNRKRFAEQYTVASFLRSCIMERIEKIRRGRKKKQAAAAAAAGNVQEVTDAGHYPMEGNR